MDRNERKKGIKAKKLGVDPGSIEDRTSVEFDNSVNEDFVSGFQKVESYQKDVSKKGKKKRIYGETEECVGSKGQMLMSSTSEENDKIDVPYEPNVDQDSLLDTEDEISISLHKVKKKEKESKERKKEEKVKQRSYAKGGTSSGFPLKKNEVYVSLESENLDSSEIINKKKRKFHDETEKYRGFHRQMNLESEKTVDISIPQELNLTAKEGKRKKVVGHQETPLDFLVDMNVGHLDESDLLIPKKGKKKKKEKIKKAENKNCNSTSKDGENRVLTLDEKYHKNSLSASVNSGKDATKVAVLREHQESKKSKKEKRNIPDIECMKNGTMLPAKLTLSERLSYKLSKEQSSKSKSVTDQDLPQSFSISSNQKHVNCLEKPELHTLRSNIQESEDNRSDSLMQLKSVALESTQKDRHQRPKTKLEVKSGSIFNSHKSRKDTPHSDGTSDVDITDTGIHFLISDELHSPKDNNHEGFCASKRVKRKKIVDSTKKQASDDCSPDMFSQDSAWSRLSRDSNGSFTQTQGTVVHINGHDSLLEDNIGSFHKNFQKENSLTKSLSHCVDSKISSCESNNKSSREPLVPGRSNLKGLTQRYLDLSGSPTDVSQVVNLKRNKQKSDKYVPETFIDDSSEDSCSNSVGKSMEGLNGEALILENVSTERKKDGTGKKKVKCYKCYRFFIEKTFPIHKCKSKRAASTGLFKCDLCHRSYVQKSHLNHHIKVNHENIREYGCDICEKTFTEKQTLVVHMHMHSNNRQYRCKICTKCFLTSSHLFRHYKEVHLVSDEFSCDVCHLSYSFADDLDSHFRRVHLTSSKKD